MFFSITKTPQDNFAHTYRAGNFCINTDEGWEEYALNSYFVVYKGYVEGNTILGALDEIIAQTEPTLMGNFCAIVYNTETQTVSIKTDRYRSFPLYVGTDIITNLEQQSKTIWADGLLEIDSHFNTTETKFNIVGSFDTTPVTVSQAIDTITAILDEKTKNFLEYNTLPIKVFLSGGVDSLLVYSFLQKFSDKFEFVNYSHVYYDRFWLKNSSSIKKNWAYSQIHHWADPCVLTSGAPGDEFMLRSPVTADLFLKYNGHSISDLLVQKPECLHYDYYSQEKHLKIFREQQAPTCDNISEHICNILVNDWQHWHLGNTLTWTPLRDLEIPKILLRVPAEDLVPQIMDSTLSKQIIENNKPGLSKLISDKKNTGNSMSNLADFYDSILNKNLQ